MHLPFTPNIVEYHPHSINTGDSDEQARFKKLNEERDLSLRSSLLTRWQRRVDELDMLSVVHPNKKDTMIL